MVSSPIDPATEPHAMRKPKPRAAASTSLMNGAEV
jgi:hypothetical protein